MHCMDAKDQGGHITAYLWKVEAPDPRPPGDLICIEEDGVFICAGYGSVF